MPETPAPTFPSDVVDAICRHMNDDHAEDCRTMVRGLAGIDATAATMTGLDGDHAFLRAETADGPVEVSLPWSERLTERAQVRVEVVAMYQQAAQALGLEVSSSEGH
jgi:putative heme iron utilization protein